MKKTISVIISILFIMIFINKQAKCQVSDVDGWDKAKWGMTPNQIKNLYDVRIMKNTNMLAYIGNIKIGNFSYDITFWFPVNSLERIFITSGFKQKNITKDECRAMEQHLIKMYGNPRSTSMVAGYWNANWIFPSALVHFSARPNSDIKIMIFQKTPKVKPW